MKPVEYSDFLPIWKNFIKDAGSVFNVQMVAHHFYNLGRDTAPRELSDVEIHYEVDKWERQNNYKHDADVHKTLIDFARAILKKASER